MTKQKQSLIRALAAGIVVGGVFSVLFFLGVFETIELKALDYRFHAHASRLAPSKDIVIVTIDQNSLDYLKRRMGIYWKWPRDVYAHVIDYLSASGAKVVLLDFIFSDPDVTLAGSTEGATDAELGRAIQEAGTVVNSMTLYQEQLEADQPDHGLAEPFRLDISGAGRLALVKNLSADIPIASVLEGSAGLGAANIYPDRDGTIRRVRLFHEFGGRVYPVTALSAALLATRTPKLEVGGDLSVLLAGKRLALNQKGEVYINWYGPGGPGPSGAGTTFAYYPIANVFLSDLQSRKGIAPKTPAATFKDKIVLIGSSAPALFDLKTTPFSDNELAYPGVEIVATVINNLIDGTTMSRTGNGPVILLIFLGSIAAAFAVIYLKSVTKNVLATAAIIAGFHVLAVVLFHRNVFLPAATPVIATFFSFVTVTLINYLTEGREKRFLKKAFGQYISPAVLAEITQHPEKLKLGGEKRDITILFSDIRGFTTISEQLDPEALTHVLNEYFTPMTGAIFRNEGTLDKFIGDAIMAFFGAPLGLKEHHAAACNAALDMMDVLGELKRKWKAEGLPDYILNIDIGVGINSGPVAVGNMGSDTRFDYTVMGDHVNLSSRLEGVNKSYGTNIVVSENTYRFTGDRFIFRELDYIRVKGKHVPIKIYELVGRRGGTADEEQVLARVRRFEEGLAIYRGGRFDEAHALFKALYDERGDKASALYVERCIDYKNTPPPPDWSGVYDRREK